MREGLNEAKKQNHSLIEKVQSLSSENAEHQLRNSEVEGQMRQANTLLCQRQEGEQELMQQINKLHSDRNDALVGGSGRGGGELWKWEG